MSCSKHIIRKRPNSCPDCKAELNAEIVESLPVAFVPNHKKSKVSEEEIVDVRTSRDMLADLTKMEEDADKIVMKKERKKREVVNNTTDSISEDPKEVEVDLAIKKIKIETDLIDKYFNDKLSEFKSKILSLSTIQYEHLSVPASKCNMELISTVEKDGWKYIDMYTQSDIIKVSGFSAPVAIFTRVKSDNRKKSVTEWKKEYK